jgi:MFS family permease
MWSMLQNGYSAPTQARISEDLQLTLSQVRAQLHTQTGSSATGINSCSWSCAIAVLGFSSPFNNLQYSVFGSILTIGAMIGAVASGYISDVAGRKGVYIYLEEFSCNWIGAGFHSRNSSQGSSRGAYSSKSSTPVFPFKQNNWSLAWL